VKIIKNYTDHDFLREYGFGNRDALILNAGSSSVRYGPNCINVDITNKNNVDVVNNIESLAFAQGAFEAIVCNAVLQYCKYPRAVADELFRVLAPGGYLFVDAPWLQPLCPDTPDRYRFSRECLLDIFSRFKIVKSGASIRPGSALVMAGSAVAAHLTRNRYASRILSLATETLLYPLVYLDACNADYAAGAFYVVCKKA
jgi:SAM-dependent methyltransferase